jgi:hypothetical protein
LLIWLIFKIMAGHHIVANGTQVGVRRPLRASGSTETIAVNRAVSFHTRPASMGHRDAASP